MPTFIKLQSWKPYALKSSMILEIMTYVLCFFLLIIALVNNTLSIKLFNVTAMVGLLALILRGKQLSINRNVLILPLSIFIIGLVDLVWYSLFKFDNSLFRATYHNYLNTAKIFLFGTILVFLALNTRIKLKKDSVLYIFYTLSFIIATYAVYIKMKTNWERIYFEIGTPTGASYSIMFIGILSSVAVFYTRNKNPYLFILNSLAIFYALLLTQTRVTLVVYPLICVITFVLFYIKYPKKILTSAIVFIVLLTGLIYSFSQTLQNRYAEGVNDLVQYTNNSNSSLGARIAMYEMGIDIFKESTLTLRSAEARAQKMHLFVSEQSRLAGALEFTNIHLHNEIIEAASLKGILGIVSVLFFYIALCFTAYTERNIGLFALTLGIIGVGVSDVIIWARSIPIIIISALTLLVMIRKVKANSIR
ncbi:O-antigen ligase family protein [Escherichia sp. MR]|uniref:O-antigen ligase family protein n=1 Tax=Escherichia sp. MR TaxID=2575922 RepID=UPI0010C9411D|nr:O-antigen ligase family protein [Escherichia sp. MR]TKT81669.1 O-antigen ligase family protein [Escherichia sp. MR]